MHRTNEVHGKDQEEDRMRLRRSFAPLRGALMIASAWVTLVACNVAATEGGTGAGAGAGEGTGTAPAAATTFAPQDLTILYPFPTRADLATLLTGTAVGAQGELVPEDVFAKLPSLANNPPRPNDRRALYLVGVRANCFYDTVAKDRPCRGQLQLVFQIPAPDDAGAPPGILRIEDASVHAVYPLDDGTFQALLADLRALREAHGGFDPAPLGVHPLLAKQGLGGAFVKDLAATVLKYAGQKTLHKLTFITIETPTMEARGGEIWKLGAVEETNGVFAAVDVPGLPGVTEQKAVAFGRREDARPADFDLGVAPALPAETDLSPLFGAGPIAEGARARAAAAYDTALAIENPELRSAADTDCVSCHVTHARTRGEIQLGLTPAGRATTYAAGVGLGAATVQSAFGVRALGWSAFAPRPSDATREEGAARAVSQRVINETAYTVAWANAALGAK
jgi:hypothetical protein